MSALGSIIGEGGASIYTRAKALEQAVLHQQRQIDSLKRRLATKRTNAPARVRIGCELVIAEVLGWFGDPPAGLRRKRALMVAAWILRNEGFSYPAIGKALDRHHTSIMYAVSRVDQDEELRAAADAVRTLARRAL